MNTKSNKNQVSPSIRNGTDQSRKEQHALTTPLCSLCFGGGLDWGPPEVSSNPYSWSTQGPASRWANPKELQHRAASWPNGWVPAAPQNQQVLTFIIWERSPASASSRTMLSSLSSMKESKYLIILGWFSCCRQRERKKMNNSAVTTQRCTTCIIFVIVMQSTW